MQGLTSLLLDSFSRAPWGWCLLVVVILALIRVSPVLKKIAAAREENLLKERAADMEAMRERIAVLEAERAVDRHRINNVTQCLDALLLLIESSPEKAAQHVKKIKEMRARQLEAEAVEKATIHVGVIQGAASA